MSITYFRAFDKADIFTTIRVVLFTNINFKNKTEMNKTLLIALLKNCLVLNEPLGPLERQGSC